jgi:hypothetical protein
MEESGINYKLPVNFWCEENLRCPTITHEPSSMVDMKGANSFSNNVLGRVMDRVLSINPKMTRLEVVNA